MEVDTLVIGAGPGGYTAANRLAQLGHTTAVVEKNQPGGVCLNDGCIPSKLWIAASHTFQQTQHNPYGIKSSDISVNVQELLQYKAQVIEKQRKGISGLFRQHGVNFVQGEAMFTEANEVRVLSNEEVTIRFKHCILATGSRPIPLEAIPFSKRVISSTEALQLAEIPRSMLIVGGGYIGIELGQMFARFGAKVTLLEAGERILNGFDPEMVDLISRKMKQAGITLHTNAVLQSVAESDSSIQAKYTIQQEVKEESTEVVLVTVGRKVNTDVLQGLHHLRLALNERGQIMVDRQCRTSTPHVYAIGDAIPGPALAHKATYEAKVAAEAIAGRSVEVDYKCIPLIIFSEPECASVGYTEQEAKQSGVRIKVGKFPYSANGRALALGEKEGFVKVIADEEDVIIGAQVIGSNASELIAEMSLAIEMGATLSDVSLTIHAHPTLSEMFVDAAEVIQ
jgi:dihydrolipoamide dehydrogenase